MVEDALSLNLKSRFSVIGETQVCWTDTIERDNVSKMVLGMHGFDISHGKHLTFNGCEDFWVCPLNDFEIYNVYTEPIPNQLKCVPVKIKVHSDCHPEPTKVKVVEEIIEEVIEVEKPCEHEGCS